MTHKVSIDLARIIKLLDYQLEKSVNQSIQKKLDDEKIIKLAKLGLTHHADTLKVLRQHQNLAYQQLNIPTKDDFANLAKLVIQIEDKLDEMEEKLSWLIKKLEKQGKNRE